MVAKVFATLSLATLHFGFAAQNATCGSDGDCSDDASASLLQVGEGEGWRGWACGREHDDPYRGGGSGRCCRGLTKVQGKFTSNICTHKCFACTGRNYNKDPYAQCGGECSRWRCKVPCCEGTYEIKGHWNSGKCSYQCMCAGYGEDTYQYCAGGNPCGGSCHVPCCHPMHEVVEHGRKRCRHWGEIRGRIARGEIKESDVSPLAEKGAESSSSAEASDAIEAEVGEPSEEGAEGTGSEEARAVTEAEAGESPEEDGEGEATAESADEAPEEA